MRLLLCERKDMNLLIVAEGPWSKPLFIARPDESNRHDVLVYSAKAHPYLTGGDTVITYSTNSLDFDALLEDMSIYFPRFLRKH